jgi:hypothetical protein
MDYFFTKKFMNMVKQVKSGKHVRTFRSSSSSYGTDKENISPPELVLPAPLHVFNIGVWKEKGIFLWISPPSCSPGSFLFLAM